MSREPVMEVFWRGVRVRHGEDEWGMESQLQEE